uniref:Uncharacterized protein n=1 Tax=Cryptomonas curvata TaxID=233186 RepID=A0A7S0MJ20_9CRYP|mmetsp:Transcript_43875/g.91845  ORF Transcript_43875/g.91845 Transcript_43875/m.91845 type:complete len:249 (+) Transcript_43875:150-896(+)
MMGARFAAKTNGDHRYVLTAVQAREIFRLKFLAYKSASAPNTIGRAISNSVLLAAQYGVTSKTIRDIWNRKKWVHATAGLFDEQPVDGASGDVVHFEYLNQQHRPSKAGRPKGARDKRPRAKNKNKSSPSPTGKCESPNDNAGQSHRGAAHVLSPTTAAVARDFPPALPACKQASHQASTVPFRPCPPSPSPALPSPIAPAIGDPRPLHPADARRPSESGRLGSAARSGGPAASASAPPTALRHGGGR